jgi:hypothetical protein
VKLAERTYDLTIERTLAVLSSPGGTRVASLRLLAALDTIDGPDETLAADVRVEDDGTVVVERRSTVWEQATVTLVPHDECVEVRTRVSGRGRLTDAHLLAGRSLIPGGPTGFLPSGSRFRNRFSPSPGYTAPIASAGNAVAIGVTGDGEPGRAHWFFTPAPLFLAFDTDDDDGWLGLGVSAPVAELKFVRLAYRPADDGFSLVLDYEGHTEVDGEFSAPTVLLSPSLPDPYAGLARHRDDLVKRGAAPAPLARERRAWWSEPIFCGWGAQCALASRTGRRAQELATESNYDAFLEHLERQDVVPGTIVIDDKWQDAYGTCRPDDSKWRDLGGWIARRHARGQRVLLWWKAWDPEGLPPELCIRNPDGAAVAVDPASPAAQDALRTAVHDMLSPDGLDADGLKVDFSARTPSGTALAGGNGAWGIALLHDLLELVYRTAKEAKPGALVVTHTPHPAFVDVTDMIRLNDIVRMDGGVVELMRHRAEVARAACPELLIDTDDWPMPSLAEWRAYLTAKPAFGVPALYYTDSVDATGERFEAVDYENMRRTWSTWRSAQ